MNRQDYINLHTLDLDVQWSACGECPYINNCLHYTKQGCPNQREE